MRTAALLAVGLAVGGASPLPFPAEIVPDFALTSQTGETVTDESLRGRPVVLFFGYASCESICDVALPLMGEAIALLGAEAEGVVPVMVTIDPARDTPERLAEAMPRYHPAMLGLTGPEGALAALRAQFQVEVSVVAEDAAGDPIYAHGGFIYLIGADGHVRSLLPPVLGPDRVAELIREHLLGGV